MIESPNLVLPYLQYFQNCPCIALHQSQYSPIPIDLSLLLTILLVITPCAVVLSICIGVGGFFPPISPRAWRVGMASLQLMNSAPSLASAADDMTALIILATVNTDPLLGGTYVLLDIKKFPPAMLLAFV